MQIQPFQLNQQPVPVAVGPPMAAAAQPLFARPTDNQVRCGNILIIDDEPEVAKQIRNQLAQWGFRKFAIEESSKAVETIRSVAPDIVILDSKRPDDSLKILIEVRKDPEIQHTPVILFTNSGSTTVKLEALNAEADDFLTKPVDPFELIARVRNTISNKLMRDHISQYSLELQSDVLTDELTQISNRRAFDYELKRRIVDWKRHRIPLSLLMIDIDFFKQVNDTHGHAAGDLILKNVASCIVSCIRETDLVARYGGEEFAVIMANTTSEHARNSAERIRTTISQLISQVQDEQLRVTVSIGIANSMNGDDPKLLALRADDALYECKRQGRNCCCLHAGSELEIISQSTSRPAAIPQRAHKESDVEIEVRQSNILAIDDEPSTTLMLKKLLGMNGFEQVNTLNDSRLAIDYINEHQPDLVLLDINMPHVNGIEVLTQLRSSREAKQTPVIVLTASTDSDVKVTALDLGANDVLLKPAHEKEMLARVRNTLMAKAHVNALANYSSELEKDVRLRTAELMASRREAIQVLARAAESRDDSTGQHIIRVGRYAALMAEELGFSPEQVINLEHAAQLHDVGKIAMPDEILKKPGKLTDDEFEYMKMHCTLGSNIIKDASHPDEHRCTLEHASEGARFLDDCNSPVMRLAAIVAESHHEKWDGTGYPRGLKGNAIPIEGRITAIADVFDALSTERCYKDAISLDECFKTIEEGSGSHFDPAVVDAFIRRRFEIMEIFQAHRDPRPGGLNIDSSFEIG